MPSRVRAAHRREAQIIPYTLAAAMIFSCTYVCYGHGRLLDPPSRASMWRLGFDSPADYDDHQGYCGGKDSLWTRFSGMCGVCGDPYYPIPRAHERGGRYYTGTPTKTYRSGSWITASVGITANHRGWLEFRLCAYDDPKEGDLEYDSEGNFIEVTQRCLNRHLLTLANGETRFYLPEPYSSGEYDVRLHLPRGVVCKKCLFQWKWNVGNSWGTDPDGESCVGCGEQEQFYACADIVIKPRDGAGRSKSRGRSGTRRRQKANRKGQGDRGSREQENKHRSRLGSKKVEDGRIENTTTTTVPRTTSVTTTRKTIVDEPHWWFVQHVPLTFHNTEKGEASTETTVGTFNPKYAVATASTASTGAHGTRTSENVSTKFWATIPTTNIADETSKKQDVSPRFWKWVSSFSPRLTKSASSLWNELNLAKTSSSVEKEPGKFVNLETVRQDLGPHVNSSSLSHLTDHNPEAELFHSWWRRLSSKLNTVFFQGLFSDAENSSRVAKDSAIASSLSNDSNYIKHRSRRNGQVVVNGANYFKSAQAHGDLLNTTFAAAADGLASAGHDNNHSFWSLYDRSNSKLNTLLSINVDVSASHKEQQFTAADLAGTARAEDGSLQRNLNASIPELIDKSRFERANSLRTQQTKITLRKRFAENSVGFVNANTKAKLVENDVPGFSGPISPIETNTIHARNRVVQVQTTVNLSLPWTSRVSDTADITQYTETPTTVSHADPIYPTNDFADKLPYDDFVDRRTNSTSHFLKTSQTASQGVLLHVNSTFDQLRQKQKLNFTSETLTEYSSAEKSGILVLTLERRIDLPLERHEHKGLTERKLHDSDKDINSSHLSEQGNSRFLGVLTFAAPVTSQSSLTTAHHSARNSMDRDLSNHHRYTGVNAGSFHNMDLGASTENSENTSGLSTTNSQTNNTSLVFNALHRNDVRRILNRTLTQDNVKNDSISETQIKNTYFNSTLLNMKTDKWRNKYITERERPLHSRVDNETKVDENINSVDMPRDDNLVTDNITNEPRASVHNITLANIDMFIDTGDTNTEVYSKPQQTHLPQRSPYEKRLLLHDRMDHLLTSLKDATSLLDSNSPLVNTRNNSFADGNLITERTHIHESLQFDASKHETSQDKESDRAAKVDYLGGNSVSEKDAGELGPLEVPMRSRSGSDGGGTDIGGGTDTIGGTDTGGGTAGHTGGESGHRDTEIGPNHGKNGRLDWDWSENDESKYVNSEDTDGLFSGKRGVKGNNIQVRVKIHESFDMPTLQIALGSNTERHVALSIQKTGSEIPSRDFNSVSDHDSGRTGLANSYGSRERDSRDFGEVEGSGLFMEGKLTKRQQYKENNAAFGESQEQSNYNKHGLGEKGREAHSAKTARDLDGAEYEVGGVQGHTKEATLGNGRVNREWQFHSSKMFSTEQIRDGQTLPHTGEPSGSQLVANNDMMAADRNMSVGIVHKEEETHYKRDQHTDNVQEQDNHKYEDRKMESDNKAEKEDDTIYLSHGGNHRTADTHRMMEHRNRVKRSCNGNKENKYEGKHKEDAHEHNNGRHEEGEHIDSGHEGGEHIESGHEGGEHIESGHEGGEHIESGHEGGEHKGGGHEGGEHKEGGHEGGEHKEGGHEGDEHVNVFEHEENKHVKDVHEGGEHEENKHVKDVHEGGEHEENKHVEDVHEGGEHDGSEHEEHHNVGEHIEHGDLEDEHQTTWHEHKMCGHKESYHKDNKHDENEHEKGGHESSEHHEGGREEGEHYESKHDSGEEHETQSGEVSHQHHEEADHYDHVTNYQHHHEEDDHHDNEMDDNCHGKVDHSHHLDDDHQEHETDDQHHHEENDHHDHKIDDKNHHEEEDHHVHEMDDHHNHEEGGHNDHEMDDQHHHEADDHQYHEIDDHCHGKVDHSHEAEDDHHDHETDDKDHHEANDHHDHEMDDHHNHFEDDHQDHEMGDQHHGEDDHHDHSVHDHHHHENGDHQDHEMDDHCYDKVDHSHHEEDDQQVHEMGDQSHYVEDDHQNHGLDDQHHHEQCGHNDHEMCDHHHEEDEHQEHSMDDHHHHENGDHQVHEMDDHCYDKVDYNYHEEDDHQIHEMDDPHNHEEDDHQDHEMEDQHNHEQGDHDDHEMGDLHHGEDDHQDHSMDDHHHHENGDHQVHEMDDHCYDKVDHSHHEEDDHQVHEMDDQHHLVEDDHQDHKMGDYNHHFEDDHHDHGLDDQHHHEQVGHNDPEMGDHHHEEDDHQDHSIDDHHHHENADHQFHEMDDHCHDKVDHSHHGEDDNEDHEMNEQHHHVEDEHQDHEMDDNLNHEEGDHHDQEIDDHHHHEMDDHCHGKVDHNKIIEHEDHQEHEMDGHDHHEEGDHQEHEMDGHHHHEECDHQEHGMDGHDHHEEGDHQEHGMDGHHHHEEGDHQEHEMDGHHHHEEGDHQEHEMDGHHHHEEGDHQDHGMDGHHHHEEGDHQDHGMDGHHHHEEGDHQDHGMDGHHHHEEGDHQDHGMDGHHHHEEGDHQDHGMDGHHHHEEGDHQDHGMDGHHHHEEGDHQDHGMDGHHHHEEGDHQDHGMDGHHHHEEGDHQEHEMDGHHYHEEGDHQEHEMDGHHHHEEGDHQEHEMDGHHHHEEDDLQDHEEGDHQDHEKGGHDDDEHDEVNHSDIHEGCKHNEIKTASGSEGDTIEKTHEDNEHETFDESSNDHGRDVHKHEESSDTETKHVESGDTETKHVESGDTETKHVESGDTDTKHVESGSAQIGHDEGSHGSADVDHREEKKSLNEKDPEEEERTSDSDFGDYFSDNKESNHGETSGSETNGKKHENSNTQAGNESEWKFHNAQTYGLFGHGGK